MLGPSADASVPVVAAPRVAPRHRRLAGAGDGGDGSVPANGTLTIAPGSVIDLGTRALQDAVQLDADVVRELLGVPGRFPVPGGQDLNPELLLYLARRGRDMRREAGQGGAHDR